MKIEGIKNKIKLFFNILVLTVIFSFIFLGALIAIISIFAIVFWIPFYFYGIISITFGIFDISLYDFSIGALKALVGAFGVLGLLAIFGEIGNKYNFIDKIIEMLERVNIKKLEA